MQETRQLILEILKERGPATVDDVVADLQKRRGAITAVTVRHHLTRLQEDGLITTPQLLHRTTPGRPQHVYELTDKARTHFPTNYHQLITGLLDQLREKLPPGGVNVILEGVADYMAADAAIPDLPPQQRLDVVVEFLNQHGYSARWETSPTGYILCTANCPYHHIAANDHGLCEMDMRLVASLLGVVPRRLTHVAAGDSTCSYLIPLKSN
jgi:DeoR family transcriptional regulator, suf operon transcriptional repressor